MYSGSMIKINWTHISHKLNDNFKVYKEERIILKLNSGSFEN